MMAYGGGAGSTGMRPSAASNSGEVLGSSAAEYSPQGGPSTPLATHSSSSAATTVIVDIPSGYGASASTGPATSSSYSPQDSPTSSVGTNNSTSNGQQLASFGFTQEQVACVCEVSFDFYY